ncbi:MAG TPA: hypothetical protein VGH87_27415 [Polyangiaceae bacterium]|jgi:primosomal protein N''
MRIDLDSDEARFLHAELERRLKDLEAEVERSEDRTTQHALLEEISRLEAILMHVEGALEAAEPRISFVTRT